MLYYSPPIPLRPDIRSIVGNIRRLLGPHAWPSFQPAAKHRAHTHQLLPLLTLIHPCLLPYHYFLHLSKNPVTCRRSRYLYLPLPHSHTSPSPPPHFSRLTPKVLSIGCRQVVPDRYTCPEPRRASPTSSLAASQVVVLRMVFISVLNGLLDRSVYSPF